MKINEEQLNELKKLTELNQYGEARERMANILEYTRYEKIFKAINKLHELEGYMPITLKRYQENRTIEMINNAYIDYGANIAKDLQDTL